MTTIGLTNTAILDRPAANLLTNKGTLAIGGIDVIKTTDVVGQRLHRPVTASCRSTSISMRSTPSIRPTTSDCDRTAPT